MPYIDREGGKIVGCYAKQQCAGQEFLAKDAPELVAWQTAGTRIQEIRAELAALDVFLPRAVEDLIAAGVKGLSQHNLDRLAAKQALRAELAELKA